MTLDISRSVLIGCATLPYETVEWLVSGIAENLGVGPVCRSTDNHRFDGAVLLQLGPFIYNLEELTAMAKELRDRQKEKT
ncbi:hypothetical protein [Neorhizobium sp. DAR64861/K0K2]|uniref:hypothetical protein n=1 Tax=unclassified Neorhizobium TaxID=2629175 RepID=UPI003D2ADE7F